MNLLRDIFFETFEKHYYFADKGRAYVEYMMSEGESFSGKICFFHFSHANIHLNSFHDYEILKFIKIFYSNAYTYLLPLMKYVIEHKIVMSMNSLDEYTFIIKFWNENKEIRTLFETCIYENTGKKFQLPDDKDIRFFELKIGLKNTFQIETIIVYSEKNLCDSIEYIDGYVDLQNIFMTLEMKKYFSWDSFSSEYPGVLIKFQNPICFSDSRYLQNIYDTTNIPFVVDDIYLAFVEQGFRDNNLYFTHKYSIPA